MPKRVIFDKKNVLVTGGAGFLGSHLCDRLAEDNKVICVDNFIGGDERNIDHLLSNPNFVFIKADITRPLELENLPELQKFKIQFQGVQEIYNAACPTSPARFAEQRMEIAEANSAGVKNMLELARKYQAVFVQFSSSVVYGPRREDNQKIGETDLGIVNPISERACYDEGKRFAESLAATYRGVYGLDVKIARLFRAYGPRMKLNDDLMIPDFVVNALDNKDLAIYGDADFNTSLCYVDDAIDGLVKLAASEVREPINIGSDQDENLTLVAQKIIALTASRSKIKYEKPVLFMTKLAVPDIRKAKEELHWMPVTTLERGLQKTVDDLRASKGLLGVKHAV
ncbi:NAD-dependent dehydratase [Candidatus Falkowbacteria bacterium CG10_big_fil_rev_8_21_14_0_10_43_11]|uniref:NAD-dependent dehydratase n=1 Tax=Candidatus Falkowbacteria bacterium CG10_big_fil_rev_8_21_14_0_10_43_11 TaxID=1974568 RepID=A0A2M6WLA6_9BACT|nr:MAG: NAD-dependent dehydratase [Candidatus Falkowbacteria bacterium CG10_big_fil_rev_8_21_14_0_10_43_11]